MGRGPLPLPLPRPFFAIVYLSFPAWKSIYHLSRCPEGQQMKFPVIQTRMRWRRGPKLSQYLRGPAGFNFPGFNASWYAVFCRLARARQTLVQWNDSPKLPSLMLPMCITVQNVTYGYKSGFRGGGEGKGQEARGRRQGQGHRAPFSSHLSAGKCKVRSWPASSSCVR